MKSDVNINFSKHELEVIKDTSFLNTKNSITKKIIELFYELNRRLKVATHNHKFNYPKYIDITGGKVSRGENYDGLPYIILDFPKHFKNSDIFSFRTIFLWGREVNFTLHLAGYSLDKYRDSLKQNCKLIPRNYYIYNNTNEWRHEISSDNYKEIIKLDLKEDEQLLDRNFIKFSRKIDLISHNEVIKKGVETYETYLDLLI